MEKTNSLMAYNVIGRITHGLIGLDLFLNEGKTNNYLKDFLTLKEEEMKVALLSTSHARAVGLVPIANIPLSEEQTSLIQTILKTQEKVRKIGEIEHPEELEPLIGDLGSKLDVMYRQLTY